MNLEQTGKMIAQLRREKGMTQQTMAQALHITDKAVSKWERGLSFPDVAQLEPLANLLEADVVDLLQGQRTQEKLDKAQLEEDMRQALRHMAQQETGEDSPLRRFFAMKTRQQMVGFLCVLLGICFTIVGLLGMAGRIWVRSNLGDGALLMLWLGIGAIVVGAPLYGGSALACKRRMALKNAGKRVTGEIVRIKHYQFMDMPFQKNTHPYEIQVSYSYEQQTYHGKSFLLWEYPYWLKAGDGLPIYLDENKPSRCYVELLARD